MFLKKTTLLFLLISSFLATNVAVLNAQLTSYSCDFENITEFSNWNLNTAVSQHWKSQLKNRWFTSVPGANEGRGGLYISSDTLAGKNTLYTNTPNIVVAERPLTMAAGAYTISFDWQALGMSTYNTLGEVIDGDAMYVCWVPANITTNSNPVRNDIPAWVNTYALKFNGNIALRLSTWDVATTTFTSNGTPHKLVFVWRNSSTVAYPPGPCVDNIDIKALSSTPCPSPTNISVIQNGNLFDLSWSGSADSYDVRVCSGAQKDWSYKTNLTVPTAQFVDLNEGVSVFYVRSKCGAEYSPWVAVDLFIFYEGNRCVEYLAINDANCKTGYHGSTPPKNGKVDHGYFSRKSRHTIHYAEGEVDPRTAYYGGGLRTVPKGELASIRLGNWEVGNESESVEYTFIVDTLESAKLLLKYAVVLENPVGHEEYEQASFTLELTDLRRNPISAQGCGEASFAAGYGTDSTWHNISPDPSDPNAVTIQWKDWTTIGIDLAPYHGDTVIARLITSDCGKGGHFGYAYYTISCNDGKIQGLSCGDSEDKALAAPEGFNYKWYNVNDMNTIISTDRILPITDPTDDNTYICYVIQPTNEECFFTVTASAMSRYPVADAHYKIKSVQCENVVEFKDRSTVALFPSPSDTTHTDDPIQEVWWDFGDGTTSQDFNPTHIYPTEGGTYRVKLTAAISDSLCADTTIFNIVLPDLSVKESTKKIIHCLQNGPYYAHTHFGDSKPTFYFESTLITDTLINPATGCDSVARIDLKMVEQIDSTYSDTACTAEPYMFNDRPLTMSGIYADTIPSFYGCDSVITLNLQLNLPLIIEIPDTVIGCANDEKILITYEQKEGLMGRYEILFEDIAMESFNHGATSSTNPDSTFFEIPIIEAINPNLYKTKLIMDNTGCGDKEKEVILRIDYPDSVLAQRWNDVIGLRNKDYNGYNNDEFTNYQWYINGQPILEATAPNLYVPDGLDFSAQYTLRMMRISDSQYHYVCAPAIKDMSASTGGDIPGGITVTFTEEKTKVNTRSAGLVRLWSASGMLIKTQEMQEGNNTLVNPNLPGIYILEFNSYDGERETHKIIVQ